MAMVAVQVTILGQEAPEVAAILADSGAAGRRHLVRSCRVGAPSLAPIGWRPGLGRLTLKESLAKPSAVDKDRNDQSTMAILLPDGFLVSGKFRGRNMLNFCPSLSRKCALTFWLRGHV